MPFWLAMLVMLTPITTVYAEGAEIPAQSAPEVTEEAITEDAKAPAATIEEYTLNDGTGIAMASSEDENNSVEDTTDDDATLSDFLHIVFLINLLD